MDTKNLIYPNKGFSKKVMSKLNKEDDFNIIIKSRFSKFIMSRAIDCWPRVSNDADRMKTAVNRFLSISMFFFPTLWSVNLTAVYSGYIMNYLITEKEVLIFYTYH